MGNSGQGQKKDAHTALGRRELIRWSLYAGAALGLSQWKVLEVLERGGGRALAQDAACAVSNRSLHIVAGTGGMAWFNLLWPHNDVAAAGRDDFSFHAPGEITMARGTDKPLTLGPETPWRGLAGNRQVTAFLAGRNQTHTRTPDSNVTVAMGTDLFAACAAVQTANPTLVPVIAVDDAPYRSAQGAPRVSRVGSADDIVSLFDSAASRAGGLLATTGNAELYASAYSTFLGLRAAAGRSTQRTANAVGVGASRLLGRNLATALRPTAADFVRYGITDASRSVNRELANGLITAAKAFVMGLTSSVILPAFRDDPHGAFNDMTTLRRNAREMGAMLDAFLADLMAADDATCAGTKVGENVVVSIHGDTPKNPLERSNWPDGTPGDSNWCYVLGAGHLKTGWFGGVRRDGSVVGWNPTTGADAPDATSASLSSPAAAAILYAVTKGDIRRTSDFYRGADIGGVVASATT